METVTLQGPVVVIPAQEYEAIMNRLFQLEQSVQALTQLLEDRDDIKAMRETEAVYFAGDAVLFAEVLAEVQAEDEFLSAVLPAEVKILTNK